MLRFARKYGFRIDTSTPTLFFATTGIDIGFLIVFLFVGCVVALAAKGREMAAAIAARSVCCVTALLFMSLTSQALPKTCGL